MLRGHLTHAKTLRITTSEWIIFMNKKLYLIRGASGSGKSTLVESLMNDKPHAVAFSADDWMRKGGEYKYDKRRIGLVHWICINQVEKHMKDGSWQDIFVHNTFTTSKELKPYYKLAKEYDYDIHSLVVENRHRGQNVHDVPDETLESQKQKFQVQL